MFGFIRKLFAAPNEETPKPEAVILAPGAGLESILSTKIFDRSSFICRLPMLGRDECIVGYEFALQRKVEQRLLGRSPAARKAYDDALVSNLLELDLTAALGERTAFVHVSPASIQNPRLRELPARNTAFVFSAPDPEEQGADDLGSALATLQREGYRVGWLLGASAPETLAVVATTADFLQIDAAILDGVQMKALVRQVRQANDGRQLPLSVIAGNLATHDDFQFCLRCGFDMFQGDFVANREDWHAPKSDVNRIRVIELLNMIRSGAEVDAISSLLKTEPVLTFKLLRYLNSASMGLARQVTTISQALVILGRDSFYRWLSLLLFDTRSPGYRERILTEQALTRGRMMELLSGQGQIPKPPDQLFIAGLFSLLDVLMGQSLDEMLRQITLPEAVQKALAGEPGPIHDALLLAMAAESSDVEKIEVMAERCGVPLAVASSASMSALGWVQGLGGGDHGSTPN